MGCNSVFRTLGVGEALLNFHLTVDRELRQPFRIKEEAIARELYAA